MAKNKTISNSLLGISLFVVYIPIICFFLFIIGLSKVDAKSFDSTLIRFFNSQGTLLDRSNGNTLIHDGTVGYFLINYNFAGTIGSGSDVYIDLKPNLGFRYNPTISKLTGLDVTYNAVLSNGSVIDVSNYCNDSAHLTKTMYSSTDYGNEYRLTISCQFNSSATFSGFGIRIAPIMQSKSAITRSWFSVDNASYTNTPSDSDKIINNQNQNTNDIINNQDKNTDEIISAIEGGSLDDDTLVDDSGLNDFENKENGLIDEDNLNNISNIDISLDNNTSRFFWDLFTRIINTNSLIYGLIISILSIGIIKLILNR